MKLDPDLHNTSNKEYQNFLIKSQNLLKSTTPNLGGGGIFSLLYFKKFENSKYKKKSCCNVKDNGSNEVK